MSNQILSFPDRQRLIDEAAAWIAKLDAGHLTAADLSALRSWAGQSRQHRDTLEHVASEWDDLAVLALRRALVPAREQVAHDGPARNRRWRFASAAAVAAVAVLFGAGALLSHLSTVDATYESSNGHYNTALGEQRVVALPDGSSVHVNTNSHVEVTYGEAGRVLRLLKGEAFFNVAARADEPFVVQAGLGEVVAVGTAFAIRLEPSQAIRVTVSEGRVRVHATVSDTPRPSADMPRIATEVSEGEAVLMDGGAIDSVETLDAPQLSGRLAWRRGMLSFRDEPLATVVEEIARYTPHKIVISDPSLRKLALTGYFPIDDTAALLSTLAADFEIAVREMDGDVIYLQRDTP